MNQRIERNEMRKQISIFVPMSDWKKIRHEAARNRIPMTELCRRWMRPEIERLQEGQHTSNSILH
ncbi:hypothetical protein [Rubinisphaera italica]|uniref:CopG-like ribbon-helix-helix domain-containing protein n=1 Tax=Rubinisphaera italica TaxID=2527969 RepID=A0A5C5XL68_9PLAN|nr:hypothetical protein [Rubinisphaera italica]TWT63143.1 hypothetical protein Pan54_38950 [Rubinisphaera italica]